jgi:phosphopantothenoylcysteine decarboxylase/phosphopantothenate--cysteine ligase
VTLVEVETAHDMMDAVEAALPADVAIFAAAVSDWRVAAPAHHKIKKDGTAIPTLSLTENPDILATVAHRTSGRPRVVVGFAAETENVVANARAKLARKGCDLIVANDVTPDLGVMGGDDNTVHLVTPDGAETWPTLDKRDVARRLVARVGHMLAAAGPSGRS